MPVNYCWFVNELGGTADWIYSGEAEDFHSPEVSLLVDGETYLYRAQSFDETVWEVGTGAYTLATGTFARTAVLFNSDGDTAKIDFDDPPHVVIQDYFVAGDPVATEAYVDAAIDAVEAEIEALEDEVIVGQAGHLWGLTLSSSGATLGVAAGSCANSTGAELMALASAYTKATSAWAVGSGNGALDTGSIANSTWYHAFIIKRLDTGVVDVLISLSPTAPTLPANYTVFRRIGAVKTDGSANWTSFTQNGDEFLWSAPTQDTTSSVGTSPDLITLNVPTGVRVNALIFGLGVNAAAGTLWAITSPDQSDVLPSLSFFTGIVGSNLVNVTYSQNVRTDTSAQVRRRASAATTTIYINTFGWIDTRGRLAA